MSNTNPTQEAQILKYLQAGRSITPLAALKKFGCFRLSARIFTLRKNHNIENIGESNGNKHYARYRLVKEKK